MSRRWAPAVLRLRWLPSIALALGVAVSGNADASVVIVPIEATHLEVVVQIEDRSARYDLPQAAVIGQLILDALHAEGVGQASSGDNGRLGSLPVQLVPASALGKDADAVTLLFQFSIDDSSALVEHIRTPIVSYVASIGRILEEDGSTYGLLWETSWPRMIVPASYRSDGKSTAGIDSKLLEAIQREAARAAFVMRYHLVVKSSGAAAREEPPSQHKDVRAIWLDVRIDERSTTRIERTDLRRLDDVESLEMEERLLATLHAESAGDERQRTDIVRDLSAPSGGRILQIIVMMSLEDVRLTDRKGYSVLTYQIQTFTSGNISRSRLGHFSLSSPKAVLVDLLPDLKRQIEQLIWPAIEDIARNLRRAN